MALVATAAAQPQGSAPKPPDPGKLAQTLVTQCAGIGEGDKVMISGGTRDLVLL